MHFTPASLTLLLAGAARVIAAPTAANNTPSCPTENAGLGPRVATFTSWITDCGDKTGHTTGMHLAYQVWNDLCFPLPDDTRALEVHEVAEGCRVTAFKSPVCDDYPWAGPWRDEKGCLWTGNTEYRSFKVTCGKEAEAA